MKYLYVGATAELQNEADQDVLALVRDRIAAEFGVPTRPLPLPAVDFAFVADRGQYASTPVLQWLASICPEDAARLLAITARDLFIPVLTFVYGHAQLRGRVAVISLARLRQEFYGLPPNRPVFLDRVHKEALHELGHTFGLVHCAERTCTMSLSTNIRQIDGKHAGFCASCRALLERRTPGVTK